MSQKLKRRSVKSGIVLFFTLTCLACNGGFNSRRITVIGNGLDPDELQAHQTFQFALTSSSAFDVVTENYFFVPDYIYNETFRVDDLLRFQYTESFYYSSTEEWLYLLSVKPIEETIIVRIGDRRLYRHEYRYQIDPPVIVIPAGSNVEDPSVLSVEIHYHSLIQDQNSAALNGEIIPDRINLASELVSNSSNGGYVNETRMAGDMNQTIEVRINGGTLDWTAFEFDKNSKTLYFTGRSLERGDVVGVRYASTEGYGSDNIEYSQHVLGKVPEATESMEVCINQNCETQYSYDDELNRISFEEGHFPNPGDEVMINYQISEKDQYCFGLDRTPLLDRLVVILDREILRGEDYYYETDENRICLKSAGLAVGTHAVEVAYDYNIQ